METLSANASFQIHQQPGNYDELSMHQSILFADSLKDLKNLKTQLYSAAEYFELSYLNDDQKDIVVETLKDYAIKALINTVDHLGSVTYKVNDLLEEKVEEVSGAEIRVSCIEQRLKTCKEYIDREGVAQQASIIDAPRYHKRYILPVGETIKGANVTNLKYHGCSLDDGDDWNQFRNAVRATLSDTPSSSFRNGHSVSPALRSSRLLGTFSFNGTTPKKDLDRRSVSPHRFPLLRSGSLATRPTTPKTSRPTTPNSAIEQQHQQQRHLSKPGKSASMRVHDEKESHKELQRYPSKSKRLLKALLSRRKSKKDETLYTFLDEY